MMSSEVFENHEDDFRNLYLEIRKKVDDRIPRCLGEERKRLIREVERNIEEAAIVIQEMEDELKTAPLSFRTQMLTRVRGYKRDVDQLGRDLGKLNTSGFDTPGFGRGGDFEDMASSQRARLFQGTESLNRASESIARSQRVAAETDQIGAEVIEELGTQRESLIRTRDRLTDTDSNLRKSRKILKSMAIRVMTNKLILIVMIVVLLGILGGLVYWKFFS